jgi:hypothetical protein
MSRRTCAATRTVDRKVSGGFSRGLRVYHFGSALWASRVLRRLARGCGRGSWGGSCGTFLKPSVVGLSPPSSAPECALSARAGVPSATQGYPCSARALRGYGNATRYPPNTLRNHGRRNRVSPCFPFASLRRPEPYAQQTTWPLLAYALLPQTNPSCYGPGLRRVPAHRSVRLSFLLYHRALTTRILTKLR